MASFIHELVKPRIDYEAYRDGLSNLVDRHVSEGLDYLAETKLTASQTFNPEAVGIMEFRQALQDFALAGLRLNKFKKVLFRKQTRAEAGLLPLTLDAQLLSELPVESIEYFDDLFHGVVGVCTEAGESAEIIVNLIDGKPVDTGNVREEVGDLLWYIACMLRWTGWTFLQAMVANITKLRKRHGASFSKAGDMNRDLETEHSIFKE